MTNNFNDLSPAEIERLALLIEECSEVIKVCTKVLRHGWQPAGEPYDNRAALEQELGDVRLAERLMITNCDVHENNIIDRTYDKKVKLNMWLRHNVVR